MGDRERLYLAAFVRALATGLIGVLLGVYLGQIGLDARTIGVIVSVGLAGAAAGTFLVTFLADRLGHRRVLLAITLLSSAGGVVLALGSHPLILGAAAFLGMVNGMGRDRGAALVLEQAVLPATVSPAGLPFAVTSAVSPDRATALPKRSKSPTSSGWSGSRSVHIRGL